MLSKAIIELSRGLTGEKMAECMRVAECADDAAKETQKLWTEIERLREQVAHPALTVAAGRSQEERLIAYRCAIITGALAHGDATNSKDVERKAHIMLAAERAPEVPHG